MFNAIRTWFANIGKLPAALMSELQNEGIILMNEKLRGTITYRDFHAPGKRFLYKKSAFTSTIVVTKTRLFATSFSKPAINVPFTDDRIRAMKFSVEDGPKLLIVFDASLFQPKWSGKLEFRFKTPDAQQFLDTIQQQIA
jgi:hypothetical protein